jgi:glycosyltransferase involved in cell wall biosynthesis
MTGELVSVVVPVYNGAAYLAEALDSILGQTYRTVEVIVVDDGSTDRTAQVLDAYAGHIRRRWQANQGPARALNAAVAEAQGDFLAFLDADDVWHPRKLERQVARLQERPAAGYSLTWMEHFWLPELRAEAQALREGPFGRPSLAYLVGGLLARRWAVRTIGPFEPTRADDTEWFVRASELAIPLAAVDEVLWYRRIHRHNISRGSRDNGGAKLVATLKASLDRRRVAHRGPPAEPL